MSDRMVDGRKRHVCLAEDNASFAEAVVATLKHAGIDVTVFQRATDCLACLRRDPPPCELLITDVRLPDMDGLTLLREVKQCRPSLPVVIVTGYADVSMAAKAFRFGACDFLEKPVDSERLLAAVHEALGSGSEDHRPPRAAHHHGTSGPAPD